MNHMTIKQTSMILFALLLCVAITGCGGEPAGTVSGTVTLDGETYSEGALIFISGGQGGSVNINADGTFALVDPIPVGTYTVYAAPTIETAEELAASDEGDQPAMVSAAGDSAVVESQRSESSDQKVEVAEGENTGVTIEFRSQ